MIDSVRLLVEPFLDPNKCADDVSKTLLPRGWREIERKIYKKELQKKYTVIIKYETA